MDGVLVVAHSDKQDAALTWTKSHGPHPLMRFVDHGPGETRRLRFRLFATAGRFVTCRRRILVRALGRPTQGFVTAAGGDAAPLLDVDVAHEQRRHRRNSRVLTLHPDEQLVLYRWAERPAPPPLSPVTFDDGCTDDRRTGEVGDNGADALATDRLGVTWPAGGRVPAGQRTAVVRPSCRCCR